MILDRLVQKRLLAPSGWDLVRSWLVLAFAMLVTVFAAASAAWLWVASSLVLRGEGAALFLQFWIVAPYSLFLGIVFALLALPLLPFQKWIVSLQFPYLRWGYVAVAAYGPLLLLAALRDAAWSSVNLPWMFIYEGVALVATVIYVRTTVWIARRSDAGEN